MARAKLQEGSGSMGGLTYVCGGTRWRMIGERVGCRPVAESALSLSLQCISIATIIYIHTYTDDYGRFRQLVASKLVEHAGQQQQLLHYMYWIGQGRTCYIAILLSSHCYPHFFNRLVYIFQHGAVTFCPVRGWQHALALIIILINIICNIFYAL